jgi:hypothetical protein
MFIQTHRSVNLNGDTFSVYRDRDLRQQVTHFTAHRGGCLHTGEVTLKNELTHETFAFTVKQAPWPEETGSRTAQSYWNRHNDKLK